MEVDVDTLEVEVATVIYPRKSRAVIYRTKFQGLINGYLGQSSRYNEPVWNLIVERLPISTYYGFMILMITYVTSVPMGVLKAMKHRTWVDNWTSIFGFRGLRDSGLRAGGGADDLFGDEVWLVSAGRVHGLQFRSISDFLGKVWDVLYHSILPLICYVIGGFAFLTLMMKNHLMDNMASDYVRTAVAKGVSFKNAVRKHAFRNSLIPIATNLGHQVGLFLTGSFLIERIFDINGIGLLGYESLVDRDYPVVMGILVLTGAFDDVREYPVRCPRGAGRSEGAIQLRTRTIQMRLNPLTVKKLKRFRSIRRGYYSLLVLVVALRAVAIFGAADQQPGADGELRGEVVFPDVFGRERGARIRRGGQCGGGLPGAGCEVRRGG